MPPVDAVDPDDAADDPPDEAAALDVDAVDPLELVLPPNRLVDERSAEDMFEPLDAADDDDPTRPAFDVTVAVGLLPPDAPLSLRPRLPRLPRN